MAAICLLYRIRGPPSIPKVSLCSERRGERLRVPLHLNAAVVYRLERPTLNRVKRARHPSAAPSLYFRLKDRVPSWRGLFQYGDLQFLPGQRLGSTSESRGSHLWPQRSHSQSQTVSFTLAITLYYPK